MLNANSAFAATVTWDGGGADDDWCTDANWSNDAEPTTSDDVTIDANVTVTTDGCVTESNELKWNTLTVGGTNTATLQINQTINTGGNTSIKNNGTIEQQYFGTLSIDGNLEIESGGLLTHEQTGTGAGTYEKVDIDLGSNYLDVQSGGEINVNGLGYLGGYQGDNNSRYGRTAGNTTTGGSYYYTGGSHGGRGGRLYYYTYNVAECYDSIKDPTLPGSGGGGNDSSGRGSNGGGVIKIQAGNAFVNGTITADGAGDQARGAGGGGTVNLDVNTISGAGTIQAVGGSKDNRGAGGGGRVAITTTSQGFTGDLYAHGGSESTNDNYRDGSAGSIYINLSGTEKVLYDNNNLDRSDFASGIDSTTADSFDEMEVRNGARVWIKDDATSFSVDTLDIQDDSVFESDIDMSFTDLSTTSLYLNGGHAIFDEDLTLGSFSTSGAVTGILETNGFTYISSGNVILGDGLTWRANTNGTQLNQDLSGGETSFSVDSTFGFPSSGTFTIYIEDDAVTCTGKTDTTFTGCSGVDAHDRHEQIREDQNIFKSSGVDLDNFTIGDGGILTHTGDTIDLVFLIEITVDKAFTVSNGGTIDVQGKGYLAGETTSEMRYNSGERARETNGSEAARGEGNITSTGAVRYFSAGSHGGIGGASSGRAEGYDSIVSPKMPGGGGGNSSTSTQGSSGGGVIRINAEDITVSSGGSINANGSDTGANSAGAGGAIYLNASDEIAGAGAITANGGNTGSRSRGGGGRIALYYSTLSHSGTLSAYGELGGSRETTGAAGTIFKKDTDSDTYGHIICDNNSNDQKYYTVIDEDSQGTFDTVTLQNYAKLRIEPTVQTFSTTKLSVPTNTYFESDMYMTFSDINSSYLDLSGGTAQFDENLTLSSFDTSTGATGTLITNGQTYVLDGDVTIGNGFDWQANVAATHLTSDIIVSATTIPVNGTWGFDDSVITIYIDNDIITCTGKTDTSFTGCSGVDSAHYNDDLVKEGQSIWQNVSNNLNNITILNGGNMSHQGATEDFFGILEFELDDDFTVSTGGTIDVSSLGYMGGEQNRYYYDDGVYTNSHNNGEHADTEGFNTGANRYWAGGSHGGRGGDTSEVAESYDSIISPTLPGGGGCGTTSGKGGMGGGIVRIRAENIALNGDIKADGGEEGDYSAGAGGSIYLNATSEISGTGNVSANGGNETSHGGGGGGRIAVIYSSLSVLTNLNITAHGGSGGGSYEDGSSGTYFYKDTDDDTYGHLLLDNNNNLDTYFMGFIDEDNDEPFDTVIAQNGGQIWAKSTAVNFDADYMEVKADSVIESDVDHSFSGINTSDLYINEGIAIFGGTLTLSTFDTTSRTGTLITEGTDTLYVNSGSITVGPNFTWYNKGSTKKDASNNIDTLTINGEVSFGETTLTTTGNVTINSGGNLTHTKHERENDYFPQVNITAGGDFIVNTGGTVNVDEKGYLGASNPAYEYWGDGNYHSNANTDYDGHTDGNSLSGGSYYYEGGSHGGRGGTYSTNVPAEPYDSILNPVQSGGGGGGAGSYGNRGGNGGGKIRITATNITVSGDVTANGGDGARTTGAGGTIYLNASNSISGSGAITADGGDNAGDGRGGGGRVAIYYNSETHSGLQTACGGVGDNRTETGAAGTVFKKSDTQTYGTLIIGNCGNEGEYNTTLLTTIPEDDQQVDGGYAFDSVEVSDYGVFDIPAEIDPEPDGGYTEDRLIFIGSCPADNDNAADGEIVYDSPMADDGVLDDYFCNGFIAIATNLYSHSTDAGSGDTNPENLTSLTPVFSAVCQTYNGQCTSVEIEVDDNANFSSPVWQSGEIDITDVNDDVRIENITYAGSQLYYNTTYYWRIKTYSGTQGSGWSDELETATFLSPRLLELYNFSYGGSVQEDEVINIEWGTFGGENDETVKIEYSTDSFGGDINTIASSVSSTSAPTSLKTHQWTIPSAQSVCGSSTCNNVKLRLSSNNDNNNYNIVSETGFTIQESTGGGILKGRTFSGEELYTQGGSNVEFSGGNAVIITDWYNTSWDYRKAISIDNTGTTENLDNYQTRVELTNANFDFSKAKSDGSDLRFTDSDKTTGLDYWIEDYDDTAETATIWVEVPSIPASSSKNIYMYYGNSGASAASNPSAALVFWDDFDSDTSGNYTDHRHYAHSGSGSWTWDTSNSRLTNGNNNDCRSLSYDNSLSTMQLYLETYNERSSIDDDAVGLGWLDLSNNGHGASAWDNSHGVAGFFSVGDTTDVTNLTTTDSNFDHNNGTFKIAVARDQDGKIYSWFNDTANTENGYDDSSFSPNKIALFSFGMDPGAYYSYFLARKYVNPEPTTSLGSEENQSGGEIEETIVPKVGHTFDIVSDFSATTSGTGEVKFQITDDNGSSWYYCVGDTLTSATAGFSHSNTAAEITDTCLSGLSPGTFNIRAYLKVDSGETATLSDVSFDSFSANAPEISTTMSIAQQSDDNHVNITYTLSDADDESDIYLTVYEYSLDNTDWSTMTATGTDPAHDGVTNLRGEPTGTSNTFVWRACNDISVQDDTVWVRLRPHDGQIEGDLSTSDSSFSVDCRPSEGSANIHSESGSVTVTGHGAYANGLIFNFTEYTPETKAAEADSSGTPLNVSTDYLTVTSTLGSGTWDMETYSTDFSDGGTTYTLNTSSSSTDIVLEAPSSDQNSVSQNATISSTTGSGCSPVDGDVNLSQVSALSDVGQVVADIDNNDNHLNSCESYDTQILIPLDMESITSGFEAGTYSGTITFIVAAE